MEITHILLFLSFVFFIHCENEAVALDMVCNSSINGGFPFDLVSNSSDALINLKVKSYSDKDVEEGCKFTGWGYTDEGKSVTVDETSVLDSFQTKDFCIKISLSYTSAGDFFIHDGDLFSMKLFTAGANTKNMTVNFNDTIRFVVLRDVQEPGPNTYSWCFKQTSKTIEYFFNETKIGTTDFESIPKISKLKLELEQDFCMWCVSFLHTFEIILSDPEPKDDNSPAVDPFPQIVTYSLIIGGISIVVIIIIILLFIIILIAVLTILKKKENKVSPSKNDEELKPQ